jgi:hypothetical protein
LEIGFQCVDDVFQWLIGSVITGAVFFDEIADITQTQALLFTLGLACVIVGVVWLSPVTVLHHISPFQYYFTPSCGF